MPLHPLMHDFLSGLYGRDATNRVFGKPAASAEDYWRDRDAAEAERFALELARDQALGDSADWPGDGGDP